MDRTLSEASTDLPPGLTRRKHRSSTSSTVGVPKSAPGPSRRSKERQRTDSWESRNSLGSTKSYKNEQVSIFGNYQSQRHSTSKPSEGGWTGAFLADPIFYCRAVGIGFLIFISMAGVGAILQIGSGDGRKLSQHIRVEGIVDESAMGDEVNWKMTQEAVGLALATTWLALKLWLRLILSIVLPTSQRSWIITKEGWTALQPSLRQTAIWFVNTDPLTKAAIFTALAVVVAAWMLEREIRRRRYVERVQFQYNRYLRRFERRYGLLRDEVERQSRFAAQLLPHVLFLSSCLVLEALVPSAVHNVAAGFYGWGIAIGFPVVAAARALMVYEDKRRRKIEERTRQARAQSGLSPDHPMSLARAQGPMGYMRSIWTNLRQRVATSTEGVLFLDDEAAAAAAAAGEAIDPETVIEEYRQMKSVVKWLRYWTVMGVALLLEQLPLTGHVIAMVPVWPELRLIYSLWLQIPGTHGSDLAFTAVVPFISKFFKRVKAPETRQSQNLILNALFAMGFINGEMRGRLVEVFDTGGTLILISVPFLFTPAFITNIGILIVGLGYPVYSSAVCLLSVQGAVKDARVAKAEAGKRHSKRGRGSTSRRTDSLNALFGGSQCAMWLEYWVVYSLFVMAQSYISWFVGWFIPLWTHMLLLGTLWLQLPYFRGAHAIFKVANDLVEQWRKRSELPDIQEVPEPNAEDSESKQVDDVMKTPVRSGWNWLGTPLFGTTPKQRPQSTRSHRSKSDGSSRSNRRSSRVGSTSTAAEVEAERDHSDDKDEDNADVSEETKSECDDDMSVDDEDEVVRHEQRPEPPTVPDNKTSKPMSPTASFFSLFGGSKAKEPQRTPSL